MVAGPYFAKNLEALNTGGRLVHIATQGGGVVELPIMTMMQKRLVITGSTLRPRSADEKARLTSEVERVVWPWIEAGRGAAGRRSGVSADRGGRGARMAGRRLARRQGGAQRLTAVSSSRASASGGAMFTPS